MSETNISGGSLLSIGGDYTGDALDSLAVINSTLRVPGSVVNSESDLRLFGSKAVIGGGLTEFGGSAVLSASSLNTGGFLVGGGSGIIENGSTLTVSELAVVGGSFDLDTTSSATVLGNFSTSDASFPGFSQIDGNLFVKGTLFNSSTDPIWQQ